MKKQPEENRVASYQHPRPDGLQAVPLDTPGMEIPLFKHERRQRTDSRIFLHARISSQHEPIRSGQAAERRRGVIKEIHCGRRHLAKVGRQPPRLCAETSPSA